MTNASTSGWWERERQRTLKRVLICLVLVLTLIGYFRYISLVGKTGIINGINFPTKSYIAFVRHEDDGTSAIYAVRADGSDLRRLTTGNDAANKEHPSWTPDGKTLVFASNLKDLKTTQIYVLGDGAPVQLTYGSGNKFSPTVSPNGKLVAFITQGVVKTVSITGTDLTQVMPLPRAGNSERADTGNPETESAPYLSALFAPDGSTIAGIQDVSNITVSAGPSESPITPVKRSTISALPLDQQAVVLAGFRNEAYPASSWGHEVSLSWEPGGARLASSYTERPMLDPEGRPVDSSGKLLPAGSSTLPISGIQITTFPTRDDPASAKPTSEPFYGCLGYSAEPRNIDWSPSVEAGNERTSHVACEIWLLKSEGVRELAGIRVLDLVEPIGTASTEQKQSRFMDLPADVANITYLVRATPEGKPQNPRWSPDGSRLVYEVVRSNGKRDLWTINADGTNPINLTKGLGDNSDPAWSPAK